MEGYVAHQLLLVLENYSDCALVWYQNIGRALFGFVTKHACDGQTDRQTDGQNYFQDRASIAASHGKNNGKYYGDVLLMQQLFSVALLAYMKCLICLCRQQTMRYFGDKKFAKCGFSAPFCLLLMKYCV